MKSPEATRNKPGVDHYGDCQIQDLESLLFVTDVCPQGFYHPHSDPPPPPHQLFLLFFIYDHKTKRDYMVKHSTRAILIIFRRVQLNLDTRWGVYNKRQHTGILKNILKYKNPDGHIALLFKQIHTQNRKWRVVFLGGYLKPLTAKSFQVSSPNYRNH